MRRLLLLFASLVLMALPLAAQAPRTAPKPASTKPKVQFTTNMGTFVVELEPEAAPQTVACFLAYVKEGHYSGTLFHRVMATFMIQGGGHKADMSEKPAPRTVAHEGRRAKAAGLSNVRGSLAMARTNDPNSGGAQFYINVVDNPNLDPPSFDGWGYTVFGRVVSGMEVVDAIRAVRVHTVDGMENVPVKPVIIKKAEIRK